MRVRPGERIGPYTVLAELASGGMGCVYLARSPGGRTLAVKTLLSEAADGGVADADRRRFAREVSLARRVQGAYTVSIVDADAAAPLPWMATEYIAAPSLRHLVETCGPLPASAVRWVAAGVAEALISVHSAGLVHRDVKPSNVLLPAEGPRVIDFGISQAADVTRTHAALGTIAFTAPEQARGETSTPASDVYSLGATLFYLAVGRPPYRDSGSGPALEQLVRVAQGELDLTGLPAELDPLIRPCLALDPAARPVPGQLLDQCSVELLRRPDAHGVADWLPPSWGQAIDQHRERRAYEAEEAQRRVAPDAMTRSVLAAPPTAVLTRQEGDGGSTAADAATGSPARRTHRGRRSAWLWGAALLALGAVGVVFLLWDRGASEPGMVAPAGRLTFLPITKTAPGACPTPGPNSYTSKDGSYCASVSTNGTRLDVDLLVAARSRFDNERGWFVSITFDDEDGKRFSALTAEVAGNPPPQQVAIILGDRLLSAPAAYSAISGGRIDISGSFTKQETERLARDLGAR
ncbi:protein kinase [Streptomyces sp. NPDC051662]|uniref:serine/threonine-protein kinase n=1 Tax=Streptomyces sp. NPDC051662 TaxID=3154750 RepID=UPI003421BE4A